MPLDISNLRQQILVLTHKELAIPPLSLFPRSSSSLIQSSEGNSGAWSDDGDVVGARRSRQNPVCAVARGPKSGKRGGSASAIESMLILHLCFFPLLSFDCPVFHNLKVIQGTFSGKKLKQNLFLEVF